MKFKRFFISLLVIVIFLITAISAYAANGNAIIKSSKFMIDTELSFTEGITWKEYIDKYSPAGLTYSSTYVYYNGNVICYFNAADMMGTGHGNSVDPEELIYSREYIHAYCSHNLTITQVGTYPCEEKTRVSVCSKCGYRIEEYFAPSIDHNYTIDLDTYVSPSCGSPGYADYNCSYCGSHYSSEVLDTNPDNHFPIAATCTTGMFCRDCGVVLSDPKGHDLNKLGRCQRNGCDYFNPLDNFKGLGTNIKNDFNNIKQNLNKLWTGVTDPIQDAIENAKNTTNKALKTVVIIFFVILVLFIVRLVYKLYCFFNNRKRKENYA